MLSLCCIHVWLANNSSPYLLYKRLKLCRVWSKVNVTFFPAQCLGRLSWAVPPLSSRPCTCTHSLLAFHRAWPARVTIVTPALTLGLVLICYSVNIDPLNGCHFYTVGTVFILFCSWFWHFEVGLSCVRNMGGVHCTWLHSVQVPRVRCPVCKYHDHGHCGCIHCLRGPGVCTLSADLFQHSALVEGPYHCAVAGLS